MRTVVTSRMSLSPFVSWRELVAETVADRHGWPLYVIDDAADDPARDQPAAFASALRHILGAFVEVRA